MGVVVDLKTWGCSNLRMSGKKYLEDLKDVRTLDGDTSYHLYIIDSSGMLW